MSETKNAILSQVSGTKPEIRYGIFAGIGTVLLFSVLWLSFPESAFGLVSYYTSFLLYFLFMFLAVNESHQKTEGGINFRTAARTAFVVYLIANLFFYLFFWFMHSLNPEIAEMQRADYLENAKHFFPKNELDDQLRALEKADFSVTAGKAFTYYIKGIFGAFAASMFVGGVHVLRTRER